MKKNNKLENKAVELSLLKCVSAGHGGIYVPPVIKLCSKLMQETAVQTEK